MSVKGLIILILFQGLFSCCYKCESETQIWKKNAIDLLAILKDVDNEIMEKDSIFDRERFENGNLYIDEDSYLKVEEQYKVNLPMLRLWFEKTKDKPGGRSYISYEKGTITAGFQSCYCGSVSYNGYIYFSTSGIRPGFTKNWKSGVELKDSLVLDNNWYYILSRCNGCLD